MRMFVCKICGHVEFGVVNGNCRVCHAPAEQFAQNDKVFTDAAEKSKEGAVKHIPSIKVVKACGLIPENSCTDVHIRIGEVLHPMTAEHAILWIDAYRDGQYISRYSLTTGVQPASCLHLKDASGKITVVAFCNLHGHWQAEVTL